MRDDECVSFLRWALPRRGLRWAGFRKPRRQVCRRIARRMRELGFAEFAEYRDRLTTDAAEWEVLESLCRVTISRFLRDRGVFEALGTDVLPDLAIRARAAGRPVIDAWSVGCASGEEPYSLQLVWQFEIAPRISDVELKIVATDIDEHMLARGARAVYSTSSLREVQPEWKRQAFQALPTASGENEPPASEQFRLRPDLARDVVFLRHDVRRDEPPGSFDLVCCRNLAWTYFETSVQQKVLARITGALRSGGVLVTGAHESLPRPTAELVPIARSVYRRV